MDEISMMTSALAVKQALSNTQLSMAILKNAQKNDQAMAQMLMENIKAGQTVINRSASGTIDLYV